MHALNGMQTCAFVGNAKEVREVARVPERVPEGRRPTRTLVEGVLELARRS